MPLDPSLDDLAGQQGGGGSLSWTPPQDHEQLPWTPQYNTPLPWPTDPQPPPRPSPSSQLNPSLQDAASMTHQPEQPNPVGDALRKVPGAVAGAARGFNDQMLQTMMGGPAGLTGSDLTERARAAAQGGLQYIGAGIGMAEKGALGIAGGGLRIAPDAQRFIDQHIAPNVPPDLFWRRMFGGFNHDVSVTFLPNDAASNGNRLSIHGHLLDQNGNRLAQISRIYMPEMKKVYHGSLLVLDRGERGQGVAKKVIGGEFDMYQANGIENVGINATDSGSAIWPKFGWTPYQYSWDRTISPMVWQRAGRLWLEGALPEKDRAIINAAVRSGDPNAIRDITDIRTPYGPPMPPGYPQPTIGFKLLENVPWAGNFSFNNPEQLGIANEYLKDYRRIFDR